MTTIWLATAEHKEVPGRQVMAFTARKAAMAHRAALKALHGSNLEYCDVEPVALEGERPMPKIAKTAARYRLDMTDREAEVIRRLLEQAEYADLDNRTAGTIARVVRRIQFPNLPAKES
jgi:chorismate mutase